MSWRQPESISSAMSASITMRNCAGSLIRHLRDIQRVKAFKEALGLIRPEPGVLGFNTEEKPVATGTDKPRRVEDRVIRLRQPVQGQHAKDRSQRSSQNCALKSHRNEGWPGMEGLAANVDGIVHRGNPELQ